MSEYIFSYLLAHERGIFARAQAQSEGWWDDSLTGKLGGKTIGILGIGSIGAEIARTAKCFRMTVWGVTRESETCPHVDRYFHPPPPIQSRIGSSDSMLDFARGLDYLVSVLPGTPDTRKIIDGKLLSALPAHAFVLNAGRGTAVDGTALIDALNGNKIAGAVLDVFDEEPLPQEHPFWKTRNLRMTFHTSAPSFPADLTKLFIENYLKFNEGLPLKYRVIFERGY
jgi:phosphoglycerate dehydrogenase-like enzyme